MLFAEVFQLRPSFISKIRCGLCLKHTYTRHVASQGRHGPGRSRLQKLQQQEDPEELRTHLEEAEEVQDWVEENFQHPTGTKDAVNSQGRRSKASLIYKIIKRKYFRLPQETNLLTWAAKEQMRFLHQEFPDEWTIERLAESFPVSSEDGVRKILKSSFVPKTISEIERHDRAVQARWLALKSGTNAEHDRVMIWATGGGPLSIQQLVANSGLSAASYTNLPLQTNSTMLRLPAGQAMGRFGDRNSKKNPGLFESIVKSYCESKSKKETGSLKMLSERSNAVQDRGAYVECGSVHSDSSKGAGHVVTRMHGRVGPSIPRNKSISIANLSNVTQNTEHSSSIFSTVDAPDYKNRRRHKSAGDRPTPKSLFDVDFNSDRSAELKFSRLTAHDGDEYSDEYDKAMTGTKRLSPDSLRLRNRRELECNKYVDHYLKPVEERQSAAEKRIVNDRQAETLLRGRTQGYLGSESSGQQSRKVYNEIKFDSPRSSNRSQSEEAVEAYIYDQQKGYQHPYGRNCDNPDRTVRVKRTGLKQIKSVHNLEGTMYCKGNEYYDDDGEFLFRTP